MSKSRAKHKTNMVYDLNKELLFHFSLCLSCASLTCSAAGKRYQSSGNGISIGRWPIHLPVTDKGPGPMILFYFTSYLQLDEICQVGFLILEYILNILETRLDVLIIEN